jgi:hypothetical protein
MTNNNGVCNGSKTVGKKENINQVIKDCFITKPCGVLRPTTSN